MVDFCDALIWKIKATETKEEIPRIIRDSIVHVEEERIRNVEMHIMNMIVMLRATRAETSSPRETENIAYALRMLRLCQEKGSKVLF